MQLMFMPEICIRAWQNLRKGEQLQRKATMNSKQRLTIFGAIAFGLLAGWIDFNSEEVQLTALMIIAFSFGFSSINPKQAWLIALLMGGGVPVVSYTARAFGLKPLFESTPWYAGIILPLIIAFVAAYMGVFVRWLIKKFDVAK
jgi:hypothetical protein